MNNLQAGEICPFIGNQEVGHLSKPAESQANVRIRPIAVTGDGNGNIFFVDDHNRVVYFYNRSASDITLFGNTIRAGELYRVLGVGAPSKASSSASGDSFGILRSFGLAFDSSRKILYVTDFDSDRVYRLNNTGLAEVIMGRGIEKNDNNVDGDIATTHDCTEPYGITVNSSSDEVFVSCNKFGSIKKSQMHRAQIYH